MITHVIVCTVIASEMPGVDVKLIKLLGLNPSVKRIMLHHQGCFAGGTVLRIAKDLAENNANARVLVVNAESIIGDFRGPSEENMASLVLQAIFGDGAAALIIGADPIDQVERPIFQIAFTAETIIPDTEDGVAGKLRDTGLKFILSDNVPSLIADNIEKSLMEAFGPIGINDWNSIFWAPHPGGPKILDKIESKLRLTKDKLAATRHMLQEYGNMSSACVLFILDEMRRRSKEDGMLTTGEGLKWGVLFGFGPGLTVETVVLRSCPIV
ncbi:hypothetical protein CDL15_Pgr016060 [Punica granatum]|uniref:Chalcone synthase n=1 Tax=Punica granatum TaxID=22663 RepID=A0A218XPY4_PUNGR|nr:hypothetical protein CDL15_Pgr016060 [Punica granatum]